MMTGAMPNTISTTLETSPSPNTMNRIGRIAIGGTSDKPATNGANPARNSGVMPTPMPTHKPRAALIPSPQPSRARLAAVSAHSNKPPLRTSGTAAIW